MTIDELLAHESIRQTMARYNMAGDRLREEEFISVFTEDAVLESESVTDEDTFHYDGRAAIQAWIGRWRRPAEEAAPPTRARFVRHHLSTCLIDVTGPETAKARTYFVAYTDIGPDHAGYYIDTFRKTDGSWLIAHRKVRLDWRSPQSLFGAAVSNTR